MDWAALGVIGALVLSVFGIFYRMIDGKVSQKQHDEFVNRFNQHRDEGGGRVTRAEFELYREEKGARR